MQQYPDAAPVRDGRALKWLDCLDACVRDAAVSRGAREVQYPVLLARDALERAEYSRAFPHLLMSASCANGGTDADAADWSATPEPTEWCLSPAVCYHTYVQLAGCVVRSPMIVTARGRCFRRERHTAPGIRQIEFEMREVVLVGPRAWVDDSAETIARDIEGLARGVGLCGTWETAEDPFFLPSAGGKALMQRMMKLKLEYVLTGEKLPVASVNRHNTFFGDRFQITTPDGAAAYTACIAVGLDRWCQHARHDAAESDDDLRRLSVHV